VPRDHVTEALDRLPAHVRDDTFVSAIVQVFAERYQVIADARFEAVRALDLSSATIESYPWALNLWATLLATPIRAAWTGAQARRALLAAVVARRSCGTREDVVAVARALLPPGELQDVTVDSGPVHVSVVIPGMDTDSVMQEVARVMLLRAIPDVAELSITFADTNLLLKYDTPFQGFDGGLFL
jgi:hypothetical protein